MHRTSTEPLLRHRSSPFETARRIGQFHEAAADLAGLRQLIVNVFFIGEPGSTSWVLVDAGLSGSAGPILRAAERRFGRGSRPHAILLTHGHFDHVGGLRTLSEHWNVPIYAHPLELPYLTGRSSYPPPDPSVGGGCMALMAGLYPKRPIDVSDRVQALPKDGSVPGLPEWRWFHTPGHTAGHVSFFRDRDRAMIVGDAFVTVRQESALAVLQQTPEVNGPPAYFTPDWSAARRSVEHLASMNPDVVATGHGLPMRGERMRQELHQLAANFDRVARPRRGRYVRTPAVADEAGVISIPPRYGTFTTSLLALGAVLAAAVVIGKLVQSYHDDEFE